MSNKSQERSLTRDNPASQGRTAMADQPKNVWWPRSPGNSTDSRQDWWCSCGRSMTQPFCDGSHEGTGLEPMSFIIKEKTTVWLCNCKHTQDRPFCDGSHNNLPDDIF